MTFSFFSTCTCTIRGSPSLFLSTGSDRGVSGRKWVQQPGGAMVPVRSSNRPQPVTTEQIPLYWRQHIAQGEVVDITLGNFLGGWGSGLIWNFQIHHLFQKGGGEMRKKGLKILQKWVFFVCFVLLKKLCIHHETDVYKTNYLLLNIKNLHDFFLNLRYSDFRLHVFPLQSTQRPCFWSECFCN